jgi:hypothetical protein
MGIKSVSLEMANTGFVRHTTGIGAWTQKKIFLNVSNHIKNKNSKKNRS